MNGQNLATVQLVIFGIIVGLIMDTMERRAKILHICLTVLCEKYLLKYKWSNCY